MLFIKSLVVLLASVPLAYSVTTAPEHVPAAEVQEASTFLQQTNAVYKALVYFYRLQDPQAKVKDRAMAVTNGMKEDESKKRRKPVDYIREIIGGELSGLDNNLIQEVSKNATDFYIQSMRKVDMSKEEYATRRKFAMGLKKICDDEFLASNDKDKQNECYKLLIASVIESYDLIHS